MSSRREHVIARSSGMACILAVMLSSTGVAAEPESLVAQWSAIEREKAIIILRPSDWDSQHCPPIVPCKYIRWTLPEGCTCSSKDDDATPPPPIDTPPGCDPSEIKKQLATLTGTLQFLVAPHNCAITKAHCESIPGRHVEIIPNKKYTDPAEQIAFGTPVCAPTTCSKTCVKFGDGIFGTKYFKPEICSTCLFIPIDPRQSIDPNDKIGVLGSGPAGFVAANTPLGYTIHFENLPTASAPAQRVRVTDALNPALVDLDTFAIGPITIGDQTLVPAPGLKSWIGGFDLRPDQNLLIVVSASVDSSTGVATWDFITVDPDTGQLTENPDAGLLPPNQVPPNGEGTVSFTVVPKPGLSTGTAVANHAVIVFDSNAPLQSPTWINTVDRDAPVSHVSPLPATNDQTSFPVQWTGTDQGSGIAGFTVFVSDNGAPYTAWLDSTTTTSATYTGQTGHHYDFLTIAADLAGNVEPLKSVADASTTIGTAAACAQNVTSSVAIARSGYSYNLATRRFVQTVTLRNSTTNAIKGPIALVLDGLTTGVALYNPAGTTACALPADDPFAAATADLAPGATMSFSLQFDNPTRVGIGYVPRILAGTPR
jgi:hypothetical protein